jgi:tetratricopeptide (TPR) repeat protein
LALASSASAQDASEIRELVEINKLRKQAEQQESDGQFAVCAHTYMSLYEKHPKARRGDELLYNAVVCYEAALLAGEAIRTLHILESRFSSSSLAAKGILRRANLAASLADYEQSASAHELYARRYSGEKQAKHALSTAAVFRLALGQHEKAIADLEMAIRFYGRKDPTTTASARLKIALIYDDLGKTRDAQRYYEQYLVTSGAKKTASNRVLATARLGVLLWNASCPRRRDDGLCVRNVSVAKALAPCMSSSTSRLVRIPRKKRLAEEARKHFRTALSVARGARLEFRQSESDEDAVGAWLGAARFYLADDALEEFIGASVAAPKMGYGSSAEPEERWQRWVAGQIEAQELEVKRLFRSYELIRTATRASATWSIAAASRIGFICEEFSTRILQLEIPAQGSADSDSYCKQLTSKSAPLNDLAVGAYGFCQNLSTKLNWPSSWSRSCSERLGVLRPADFPAANEYHVPNFFAAYRQARVGLLKEAH